jgi:GTP cyclohydrolase II
MRESDHDDDVPGPVPGARVEHVASCALPTPWATFRLHAFVDATSGKEHLAITLGELEGGQPILVRVHSECLTGDALFSHRCDCGAQLEAAMQRIAAEGRGVLLYLRQEGRGIGLVNKIRAYALQEEGFDTVDANLMLGFPADARRYDMVRSMLDYFSIGRLRLMTNSPRKIQALADTGMTIVERVPLVVGHQPENQRYLETKASRLGHWLEPAEIGTSRTSPMQHLAG